LRYGIGVKTHFLNCDAAEQAQLATSVRNYVSNDGFVNLFASFDASSKNKQSPSNIHFICNQLRMYNGIPGLKEQVQEWLRGKTES
jgi:hypothetical protein